jgi:hypothetical protein
MAIQPIDLQVLFSRLNQVGKEQAEQKDGQIHNQVVQGAEIVKRTERQDHSVTGLRETGGENVRQVKDENRGRRRPGKKPGESAKDGDEDAEQPKKEIIQESYLGKHIDITG